MKTDANTDAKAVQANHLNEIRSLLQQLTNNASPSGAQTIAKQIGDHLNEMEDELNGREKAGADADRR